MRRLTVGVAACATLLTLAACGEPTKQELVDRARQAETRQQLEDALGNPDDLSKMGPVETWTYTASDGSVTFIITGDSVALQATGGPSGAR